MNKAVLGLGLWCWAAAAFAQGTPGGAASAPAEPNAIAAQSLRNSAQSLIYTTHQTPARAGRLVALSKYADQLDPCSPLTNLLLAGIYQSQDKDALTAQTLGVCLQATPKDYLLALRWMRLSLDLLQSAPQRSEFLARQGAREDLDPAARAEAYVSLGRILKGQGEDIPYRHAYEEALRLDPANPDAVSAVLAFKADPGAAQRLAGMLAILRGNPRKADLALAPGGLLGEMGLHSSAMVFYDYAWDLSKQEADPEAAQLNIISQYCSALLDAGQFRKAAGLIKPVLDRYPASADLRSLLIEAYRAMGEDAKSRDLITEMEASLKSRETGSTTAPTLAYNRDLAWFYLLTQPKPKDAILLAREASKQEPDDPVIQRILGVAELGTDRPSEGEKKLVPMAHTDVYSAMFLARYYFEHNNAVRGRQVLLESASLSHSGPAFRQLSSLASKYNVEIPAIKAVAEARQLFEQFDQRYLAMGLNPEKFLKVEIKPPADHIAVGEPLKIRAVMSNIGPIDIPLGEWGLVNPQMSLSASVSGFKDAFINLPIADWSAPRFLPPGTATECIVDLYVGDLQDYLAARPLSELTVTVTGLLNPTQYGERFYSMLPSVVVEPALVVRTNLMGDFNADQTQQYKAVYEQMLGQELHALRHGQVEQRMLVARQIASLLLTVSQWELGRLEIPRPLATAISRPTLLAMMREAMKDPDAVVKAEMLAAMQDVPLTDKALALLADWVADPSPLVRFRMAELLGASNLPGQAPVLEFLAKDPDANVRQMAASFLRPKKPAAK